MEGQAVAGEVGLGMGVGVGYSPWGGIVATGYGLPACCGRGLGSPCCPQRCTVHLCVTGG